jgi:hypothetical protein
MWSKIYLVGRRIDDIISIVKKSDELPESVEKDPSAGQ